MEFLRFTTVIALRMMSWVNIALKKINELDEKKDEVEYEKLKLKIRHVST